MKAKKKTKINDDFSFLDFDDSCFEEFDKKQAEADKELDKLFSDFYDFLDETEIFDLTH